MLSIFDGILQCRSCSENEVVVGVLCEPCASRLCGSTPICPEQIDAEHSWAGEGNDAGLIDRWGRIHLLAACSTRLGREQEGISILEPSVSRRHAVVEHVDGRWFVRDIGSSNGTTVNGARIAQRSELRSGDVVFFGDVGFVFVRPIALESPPEPAKNTTWMPAAKSQVPAPNKEDDEEERPEETFSGLREGKLALFEHSGGAGGVLEYGGHAVQLTLVQYELFRVLSQRMNADVQRDERVRGFVRSSELIASLPWDTPRADEDHLKQLIRRVRRSLARGAIADIIEARHGFGYRLRVRTASEQ